MSARAFVPGCITLDVQMAMMFATQSCECSVGFQDLAEFCNKCGGGLLSVFGNTSVAMAEVCLCVTSSHDGVRHVLWCSPAAPGLASNHGKQILQNDGFLQAADGSQTAYFGKRI